MSRGSGRLELTWTNKDMRLLSHGESTYEWVDPQDWRVSEVRLLNPVDSVGEDDSSNLLIQGDSLHALTALSSLPDFAERYVGKVRLCYIDPPFNTGQTFRNYDDAVEHSVWLTMLRDRLVQIRKLLSRDGSVWVHLDDAEQHRARSVLDEVFGAENFVATVIWEKADTIRNDAKRFSTSHDFVHVYARSAAGWTARRLPRSDEANAVYKNPDRDPRGPWLAVPLQAPGIRPNSDYVVTSPTTGKSHLPPPGKCWRRQPAEIERLIKDGQIYFGRDGNGVPQLKRYLSDVKDLVPSTLWSVKEVGGNRQSNAEAKAIVAGAAPPFSTPKPERLIERVLRIASDPGDIVLDCFAGSGTTAAVAHKMGRRWVTVELSEETVETYTRPRLEKVVAGEDEGGITEAVEWKGGGGFRVLEVAPSMFDAEDGLVFLADWATGGALADAVCAQLRFERHQDGPFAGRKGRRRLAVIDGMLTAGVVDHLVSKLDASETLVVVAQALEPGVEDYVREVRSGSRARKVPRDLARSGVLGSRLVRLDEAAPADEIT